MVAERSHMQKKKKKKKKKRKAGNVVDEDVCCVLLEVSPEQLAAMRVIKYARQSLS